jgi:Holliday junction resolvase RusA-like endonuclease
MWEIRAAGVEPKENAEKEKKTVRITSYRGRMLDKDNLYGGVKVCLDALRKLNLIHDDSPKWIELEVIQVSERLNPRTEIEISKETNT